MSIQRCLLCLPIHTHGFAVPEILDTGAMRLFVSCKLAAKLPATVQPTTPLTIVLPMGKTLIATLAIQLYVMILFTLNIAIYYLLQIHLYWVMLFFMSYRITLVLA